MPGEYIVSAKLRGRPSLAAATGQSAAAAPLRATLQTYHPGTPNVVDAEPVLLGLGEEASVQIALSTGRMATISGTILDSQGRPAVRAELMLVITAGSSRSGQRLRIYGRRRDLRHSQCASRRAFHSGQTASAS